MSTLSVTPTRSNHAVGFLLKSAAGVVLTGLLLFWPAGTLAWPAGWAYLIVYALVLVVSAVLIDPDLLAERSARHSDQKGWDKAILGLYALIQGLAIPVVAGLDVRFEWAPTIARPLQFTALGLLALGWGLHLWAMRVNRYFSQVARLQSDRGQTVCMDGPYRWVRHPGYTGGIVLTMAGPLLLGSWVAVAIGVVGSILMVIRTVLEDRMLQAELPGYRDYAQKVRWRLAPGLW